MAGPQPVPADDPADRAPTVAADEPVENRERETTDAVAAPDSEPPLPSRVAGLALETLSDMVVVTDTDGRIVYVNPAFTAVTGYTSREAIGGTPRLLSSGLQSETFYRELWDTVLRGEIWRGELVNRRRDGTLYTDEMVITPLRDEAGEITHFLAVKRAIGATLGAMADASPTGIAHLGRDGSLVYANATLERLFGAGYEDLVGDRWLAMLSDEDTDQVAHHLSLPPDDAAEGPTISLPTGRTGVLRTAPLVGRERTELGLVVTIEDVTDALHAAELARMRERFAFAIVDGLPDPTLVVDNEGRRLHANHGFDLMVEQLGGSLPDGTSIASWPEAQGGRQLRGLVHRVLDPATAADPEAVEVAVSGPAGPTWWLVRAAELGDALGAVITWTDVTVAKLEELRLSQRAHHDDLTGLARRETALDWLTETLTDTPVGLVFLDLDGFKAVNDDHGHAAGDELLLTVSRRLSRIVRSSDLAARLGGDEFLLLVRGARDTAKLDELIDRARTVVQRPVGLSVGTVRIGLSAGRAVAFPGDDPQDVLAAADEAMYRDKRRRNGHDTSR